VGEDALGQPVEIEFAVRLPRQAGELAEFGFLQIRPLVLSGEGEELRMGDVNPAEVSVPKRASIRQWPGSESARCGGGGLSSVRAWAQSGSGGGRRALQRPAGIAEPALRSNRCGTIGVQ